MRGSRYERLLAGTALALVLAASSPAMSQNTTETKPAETVVPLPHPAALAPAPTDTSTTATAPSAPAAAPATAAAPAIPAAPAIAADAQPAIDPAILKTLTGKDLVKAPIASNLAAADAPVAEKIREILATKGDRYLSRKNERSAAEVFYRDRGFAPLWIDKGAPSARATQAIAYLRGVAVDGLFPEDYPTPEFKPGDVEALADAELKYLSTVLAYTRHAQQGRIHYSRVSADILYPLDAPDPAQTLTALASGRTVAETLSSYLPTHPLYKALKEKLAEARAAKGGTGPARIESGQPLKVTKTKAEKGKPAADQFMTDSRVPLLRERLGLAAKAGDETYDNELADAVKKFQAKHAMQATGVLNTATIDAINGPRRDRDVDLIIANMERWRWLPHDLGKAYVILNIPDFTLKVMNNGQQVWTTRVVTGKPGKMATPMLTETMKFITVNPTWNVPPSIINNEYLPALAQDPGALERIGLKMETNKDGTVRIYQPPGAANALGRIRFNFPNKFLVYQHDTPDKHYFAHEKRAYSHGCMRVQNPDKYAEVLLGIANPKDGYTAEKINAMYGKGEVNINFVTPIPVHITYQSAFVDDAGKLQIRDDVYGRDQALIAMLKDESQRRNGDQAIERREISEKPAVARLPQQSPSIFSWFNRQPEPAPAPARNAQQRRPDPRAVQQGRSAQADNFFNRMFR
jgi:murein L,D-transpeptidase YcbB/YkuD